MADSRKIGFMLKDLKTMKQELQPNDDEDPEERKELKNLDKFQSKKHELNKHLKNVREGINRYTELKKKDPNNRDANVIKLNHENNTALNKAGTMWTDLKRTLEDDIKKKTKKLGEKTLSDRKKQVELLGAEIKTLVAMNSSHLNAEDATIPTGGAGAGADAGAGRNRSRTQRKREEKKQIQEKRKARRAGRGKKEGGSTLGDLDVIDVNPMSQQEQQFMDQVESNKAEQNEIIDEIGKAMDELNELAIDMNKSLKLQADLIQEVDTKMDHVGEKMKSANTQLKEMLDSNGGMTRWCPLLCFFTLILALLGYIFKL